MLRRCGNGDAGKGLRRRGMEAAPGLARGQRGLRVRCGAGADSLINLLKANVAGRRNNARSAPHRRGRYETRRGSGAQRNAAAAGARRARPPPGLPRTGRSPRPAAPRAVPLPAHHVLTPPVPLRPRTPRSPGTHLGSGGGCSPARPPPPRRRPFKARLGRAGRAHLGPAEARGRAAAGSEERHGGAGRSGRSGRGTGTGTGANGGGGGARGSSARRAGRGAAPRTLLA